MSEDPYYNQYDNESYDSGQSAPERVPPHDELAEKSVLGGMILSETAIADVTGILKGADFYAPKHEVLYEAILDLYSHGEPIDFVTVLDHLRKRGELKRAGGEEYVMSLTTDIPAAVSAGYYASIVSSKAILRRLAETGVRIAQMGYSGEGEPLDLVNAAQAEIFKVTGDQMMEDYVTIDVAVDAAIVNIENAMKTDGGITGILTGFRELDEMTNGFAPGQMIIIAARPAMGKSTLALDVARAAAIHQNKTTVFFSLEMGASEIAQRLISAEGQIHMQKLRKGDFEPLEWPQVAHITNKLRGKPLFIDDTPNMTLVEIRAKCRRLKQQNDLQMVVIDYLQLLSSGKKTESRQQEVSEFSRALKLLAKELQVPVVALAQLNRASEQRADKKPAMSDLRESGSLEQDADMVILLHRDTEQDSPRAGEADFILAKQRNGPTGTVTVAFQGKFSRFKDMGGPA